jgi:transcriptional regulator of acetoin/glycerol metabolism
MTVRNAESHEDLERLRPEIAMSWKRARLSGLAPDIDIDSLVPTNFDPGSPLMAAARPVLDDIEARLEGTSYCILFADRDCRLVHRWFDDRRIERILEGVGARTGATFLEETVGTNALGTAFELSQGIAVHDAEHFAEVLKPFSCYGHPIRHPLTKRIEGVLDLTGLTSAAHPLLAPLVARAVEDIEQRLLEGTKLSERHLLAAFQTATRKRQRALAAIGEEVVLMNKAAMDLLETSDYVMLRMLMGDLGRESEQATKLELASGQQVTVHACRVVGAANAALFHIDCTPPSSVRTVVSALPARSSVAPCLPVLISGDPGTGRTTTARDMASRTPLVILTYATAVLDGESAWAREFETILKARTGTLCVEGINLIPDRLLALVIDSLATPGGPELIFTSARRDELSGLANTLASMCVRRVDLKPLRDRGSEMRELAHCALRGVRPDAQFRLKPSVIEALTAQRWPGNLHELKAVMTHVAERRATGDVVLSDLPEAYRATTPDRPLGVASEPSATPSSGPWKHVTATRSRRRQTSA